MKKNYYSHSIGTLHGICGNRLLGTGSRGIPGSAERSCFAGSRRIHRGRSIRFRGCFWRDARRKRTDVWLHLDGDDRKCPEGSLYGYLSRCFG